MRYALIFAGVAAAYDAYGHDAYGENKASSSTPAAYTSSTPAYGGYGQEHKTSSAPVPSKSSTSSKIGYTTIHPGYGKEPVTVTSQYQPYPTCGAAGYDGKCEKWDEDKYVSTVIKDCDSKKVTVTHVNQDITVYHTKTTITHYPTASAPADHYGKAYPTGSYGVNAKKNGTQPWYEMYEKVHEIKYKDLGAHGLPGYGGSGLCKSCDDEQPYKVKEYKDGKWSEYEKTAIYKAPTPEVKTYEKPGVYTEPAKDVTVTYTMTKPSEATTTAKAGVPVTYGGVTTDFKETGVKTCAYGAYETGKDKYGNDVTSTVVKTVTVTVSTTGNYEVAKPTTTVYDHDAEVTYPTVSVYKPGVYHKDAQTVTITKAGETASCEYKQTKTYPAKPEKTPVYGDEYPHGQKSSSKPSVETKTKYEPEYPVSTPSVSKSSSKPDDKYPATSSAPYYPEYPVSSSTPVYDTEKSSSTPCSSSKPSVETETYSEHYPTSTPVYGNEYPHGSTSSVPSVDTKTYSEHYPTSTPVYGNEYPHGSTSSVPSVDTKTSSAPYYPASSSTPVYDTAKSSSTPCSSSSSTPAVETKTKSEDYPAYPTSTPVYGAEYPPSGDKTSSVPSYPATTSVPHYDATTSTPCPSSTVPVPDHKSSEYPVASSSVPVYDAYPTPTPAKTSATYPEASSAYPESNGYGYGKRAGAVQRRQAAAAKRGN